GAHPALRLAIQRRERTLHPAQREQRPAAIAPHGRCGARAVVGSAQPPRAGQGAAVPRSPLRSQRAGEDRLWARAVHAAPADVLGQRVAPGERLVHMDAAALTRKYGSTVLGSLGVGLWLVALYLLASAAQNSQAFERWLPGILLVNIAGLLTLLVLLAGKLYQLVKDFRRNVPGSRLKGRTVAIFSVLAVAPILVVYYFALQFLNRGIDSWFEIEVSQGLKDTRELSHAALEVRGREFLQHTQVVAHELSGLTDFNLFSTLERERRDSGALEFTVVGAPTQIIATSSDRPMDTLPAPATDEMMLQVRRGRPYVSLDTDATGGYVIRAAAPLDPGPNSPTHVLIALYPVPQQLSQLADTVQRSYTQYANLVQLRQPLKSTFVLILTFVVLMSLIAAVYGAFFSA